MIIRPVRKQQHKTIDLYKEGNTWFAKFSGQKHASPTQFTFLHSGRLVESILRKRHPEHTIFVTGG